MQHWQRTSRSNKTNLRKRGNDTSGGHYRIYISVILSRFSKFLLPRFQSVGSPKFESKEGQLRILI
jgi:hypothetical protein